MKITVVGMGYVGLSLAVLLSQHHEVTVLDKLSEKVQKLNQRISPISDNEIEDYLTTKTLSLTATLDAETAYHQAEYILIATPTDYDTKKEYFDTSSVEQVIEMAIKQNPGAVFIIKSTVPVGFSAAMAKRFPNCLLLFSPEFLREGHALYDNLYPSRIIVGMTAPRQQELAYQFAGLLSSGAKKQNIPVLYTSSTEAEAIKLFANTYLAMRVAFFNELDTYAEVNGLKAQNLIEGVCYDPRIGSHYNNPSFGYGGYCLPKDTRQLLANYRNIPENLITATVNANQTRKQFIAKQILAHLKKRTETVVGAKIGIYRLTMKSGSDNFRQSSIHDIIQSLKKSGITILIYEPGLSESTYHGHLVCKDFHTFAAITDLIVANRYHEELEPVKDKVYTRDLYYRD